ncbi:MAG: ArnT family glycosyltransferase, partial [Vicinamibacteria bacterium]
MRASGNWTLPSFNGEPRLNKPILFYWLVALSFEVFGENEFGARFPSAAMALLGLALTFTLGQRLFGRRAALFAAIVLALSPEYLMLGRLAITDMTLTVLILASLYAYASAALGTPTLGASLTFFTATALATLTKGPVGLLFPLLVAVGDSATARRWSFFEARRLIPGVALFLVLALPWPLALLSQLGPAHFVAFLRNESVGRFFGTFAHPEPIWYFVPVLLAGFFPWVAFLPLALRTALGERRNPAFRLLLNWTIIGFFFVSFGRGKLATYIAPIYPAVALLVGASLDRLLPRKERSGTEIDFGATDLSSDFPAAGAAGGRANRLSLTLAFSFLLAVALALPWIVDAVLARESVEMAWPRRLAVAPFVAAGIAALLFTLKRRPLEGLLSWAAAILVSLPLFVAEIAPSVETYRSTRSAARFLPPGLGADDRVI